MMRPHLPISWRDHAWDWPERPDVEREPRLSWWAVSAVISAMFWAVGIVAVLKAVA